MELNTFINEVNKMEKKNLIVILMVCATVFVGYTYWASTQSNDDVINSVLYDLSEFDDYTVTESAASLLKIYDTVQELEDDSELIIHGKILGTVSYIQDIGTPGVRLIPFIYTNVTVSVETQVKGSTEYKDVKFRIHGGKVGKDIMIMGENPLVKEGGEVVLFLKHYKDNLVTVVGGPQGRFHVVDGRVYSIGELDEFARESTKQLQTKGLDLESFIQKISN
jgi:hypothetical protein